MAKRYYLKPCDNNTLNNLENHYLLDYLRPYKVFKSLHT